ncbi:phosphate/phosphite/phosphonate ABC transporter substrate-binding protein [Weissella thailandensis]|uniref:Phosphate/phosphite/phosphonate ABC transporter substrate-binding protein n=1 Tax=Weissella thailandensis TaxID=89061 RepID=A0ABX9I4D2_9LACO|nr:phosphate/phosphite/phosphonate ABC transporter substrate-binding protein [Weissella thailandensis]NKY91064.1 phosphate/phosphite/phosphonate ABC transporter substrate-binding protein [Weissella thailandensis]RDS59432.1 phosphate/phosphite/phosphonate ABC transporter substrate-binding protein [Weissella thailandensis]GEP74551.1 phosphonate ABC transporter substrate-binding protein [Weissella thailandensis]
MFKRLVAGATVAMLATTVVSAVPALSVDAASKKVDLKELNVQFVPSSQADTIQAKAKPLEKLLKKELGIPVHVTISTDYNTVVEAMGSGKVDMGFLPPDPYVQAHKQYGAKVILQSQRYGINDKKNDGSDTDKLVDYYRALVVVKKDSGIKNVKDLKGKKIAVQNPTSDAGYIFPVVDLKKKGMNVVKNSDLVTVKGHDQGVISVVNGDTDAAFVFDDARNLVKEDNPDVFKDTRVLKYTTKIPNDTITLRKGVSKADSKTIQKAMIKVSKTDKGKKVMKDVYSWAGVTKSKDSNFDTVRKYQNKVEDIK